MNKKTQKSVRIAGRTKQRKEVKKEASKHGVARVATVGLEMSGEKSLFSKRYSGMSMYLKNKLLEN